MSELFLFICFSWCCILLYVLSGKCPWNILNCFGENNLGKFTKLGKLNLSKRWYALNLERLLKINSAIQKGYLHQFIFDSSHISFCSSFCFSFEIVPSGIFYSQESWGLLQFCAHQSHSQLQTGFTKNILFPFSFFK